MNKIQQNIGIAQKQTIEGKKDGGLPPPVGKFHNCECSCEECRRYYTIEDGEVKEKTKRIVNSDKHKTLDCSEFIENKRVNKYRESFSIMRGVEFR